MDLRERLKQFESASHPVEGYTPRRDNADIDLYVAGEEVSNEFGHFFRSITVYPENYKHGSISLAQLTEIDPNTFGLVGKDDSLTGLDLRKAVFIDTETTGLVGGVGTVPFLVGLGYFFDDGFRVDQFFMRDYDEERAVLQGIKERLENCEALVSYNGKAYDLNLLASRFTLSRMENPAVNLPHLDLLFTASRLWRRRISDCSLSNIERCVLDFHRIGDIPSFMIPGLYFDYLRSRAGKLIKPVFTHNQWDIVTLVALAVVTGKIYQNPMEHLAHPLDLLSIGKAFQRLGRLEEASNTFREALNYTMESENREEVLRLLGFSLKRVGHWEGAVKVWEHMIETTSHRILPYEELAKFYEHQTSDFKRAMEVVHRALEWIRLMEELHPGLNLKGDQENLDYRLARLKRKVGRRG